MENEIKTRSIRADNDSFEKFKLIADEFPNQAQALSALISTYEVEKSKAILPERQAEIESFSSYIQKVNEIYNHSLLLNHDAEIRIRAEFERQLVSKDTTIRDLQEKITGIENRERSVEEQKNKLLQENGNSKGRIAELEKELGLHQDEKVKSDNVIKSLTEITTEYKAHAKENETLKSDVANLQKQIVELEHRNSSLAASSEQANKTMGEMKDTHVKMLEQQKQENEKNISFLVEKMKLEKEQELLKLEKQFNETINVLNGEHQKKIAELLEQMERQSRLVDMPAGSKPVPADKNVRKAQSGDKGAVKE